MKYIGTYSNDTDIATKAKVDAKQDKITANGFLKGDGSGNITADKPVFTVTITPTEADSSIGTADKTAAEIFAAYNAGYNVQAICKVPDANVPVTLTLSTIWDLDYFILILFSVSVYASSDVIRGWSVAHTNATENWEIIESNMVPTTRTINNKPLSSNITLTANDVNALPNVAVTASDNGKFLRVVNGKWAAATVENANGVSF